MKERKITLLGWYDKSMLFVIRLTCIRMRRITYQHHGEDVNRFIFFGFWKYSLMLHLRITNLRQAIPWHTTTNTLFPLNRLLAIISFNLVDKVLIFLTYCMYAGKNILWICMVCPAHSSTKTLDLRNVFMFWWETLESMSVDKTWLHFTGRNSIFLEVWNPVCLIRDLIKYFGWRVQILCDKYFNRSIWIILWCAIFKKHDTDLAAWHTV
jgi:hypothetical protein